METSPIFFAFLLVTRSYFVLPPVFVVCFLFKVMFSLESQGTKFNLRLPTHFVQRGGRPLIPEMFGGLHFSFLGVVISDVGDAFYVLVRGLGSGYFTRLGTR